jgi:uncharacterized protein DUF4276
VSVKVYVEGGGNSARYGMPPGFQEFFERAGLRDRLPRVVPSGGRQKTYDAFCVALENPGNDTPLLLVDCEAPVQQPGPWEHLKQRAGDEWDRPRGATDEQVHLMVQCMEAWFLADPDSLETFYGDGFRSNALRAWPNLENVPKADVMSALGAATRNCSTKGEYSKGQHSFKILAQIDPAKVRASFYAARLLNTLDHLCEAE